MASGHAFCSVVSRDGSCLGSDATTEWMFASCAPCSRFTRRLAPFALTVAGLVDALVAASNFGLNASALQLLTENGDETFCPAFSVEVSALSVDSGPQLVGLSRKLGSVDEHADVAQAQRHALEDRRQRARGDHARAVRIDADRHARDEPAEVERPGCGLDRDRQAVRRAIEGSGQVHGAAEAVRIARAGVDVRRADLAGAGHDPCCACGSPHSGTDGISPTSPVGSVVVKRDRYCCPSLRVKLNV